ncbi:hypothetical protein [Aquamicrobium soli]|uniref:Uncharacterized protein n=1 Tax=Aquamicrobium soli TaxID=1811518 RepID=A0ABV7K7N0_9HYPH
MPDDKRFERDPAEGSRDTAEQQLKQGTAGEQQAEREAREGASFPGFGDRPDGSGSLGDGEDAKAEPPTSEAQASPRETASPDMEKLGAGPAIAEHSKDAQASSAGRQPGTSAKE